MICALSPSPSRWLRRAPGRRPGRWTAGAPSSWRPPDRSACGARRTGPTCSLPSERSTSTGTTWSGYRAATRPSSWSCASGRDAPSDGWSTTSRNAGPLGAADLGDRVRRPCSRCCEDPLCRRQRALDPAGSILSEQRPGDQIAPGRCIRRRGHGVNRRSRSASEVSRCSVPAPRLPIFSCHPRRTTGEPLLIDLFRTACSSAGWTSPACTSSLELVGVGPCLHDPPVATRSTSVQVASSRCPVGRVTHQARGCTVG